MQDVIDTEGHRPVYGGTIATACFPPCILQSGSLQYVEGRGAAHIIEVTHHDGRYQVFVFVKVIVKVTVFTVPVRVKVKVIVKVIVKVTVIVRSF